MTVTASRAERIAFGRRLRKRVKRSRHANWRPDPGRADPVAIMQESNAERRPDLVPIKVARMSLSPFTFYRGAAPVMAADLARLPTTGIRTQICGDAHVQNIGAFAAADGHLVFDLNDFDETIPGPWEWDLKRLAVSLVLAGRDAGSGERVCGEAVHALVRSYRQSMDRFSRMRFLDLMRYEVRHRLRRGPVAAALWKAERATPLQAVKKLTIPDRRHGRRFRNSPPLLQEVSGRMARRVLASLGPYRATLGPDRQLAFDIYRPIDVAFKVVGTGSVGTRDYVVLFFGNSTRDPLLLQIKEELPSCYARYLRDVPPFANQGRRAAEGQHRMQSATDPFLGWTTLEGRDYLVRQLADHKAKIETADLKGAALEQFALVAGEILSKAHARTGDACAIVGYCGAGDALDEALSKFAVRYADQTEQDWTRFRRAIRAGLFKRAPLRYALAH
jgi:uncharacterized protein (DUF2252 family)